VEGVSLFVGDFLQGEFASVELRQGIREAIIIDCERPKRASLRLLKDGHRAILGDAASRNRLRQQPWWSGGAISGAKRQDRGAWHLSRRSDQAVDARGHHSVAFVGGVLIAKRGLLCGMPQAPHDLFGTGSGRCGQGPGHVAQVVQVYMSEIEGLACPVPLLLPHAGTNRSASLSDEDNASHSADTQRARCSSSSRTNSLGKASVRRPARVFGGLTNGSPRFDS